MRCFDPQLVELVQLCLRTTYQFQDKFYEQSDGPAMRSSLSSVVVDLYIKDLEETAARTQTPTDCLPTPQTWLRYWMTLLLFDHRLDELVDHFNEHLNV